MTKPKAAQDRFFYVRNDGKRTAYHLRYLNLREYPARNLPPTVEAIVQSLSAHQSSPASLAELINGTARALGFETATFVAVTFQTKVPTVIAATPLPVDVWYRYHEMGLAHLDEAIMYCANHVSPGTFEMSKSKIAEIYPEMAEQLGASGLRSRVIFPVHAPGPIIVMLAFNSSKPNVAQSLGPDRLLEVFQAGGLVAPYILEEALALGLLAVDETIPITARQREILLYAAQGSENKQIAGMLNLTEATIAHHFKTLFGKFAVRNRSELIAEAFRKGVFLDMLEIFSPESIALAEQHSRNTPPASGDSPARP